MSMSEQPAEQPDKADFSANERPREYTVVFNVSGTVRMTIDADSKDEARQKAQAMVADESKDWSDIDAEDVEIGYVAKSPTMYRVIREGRNMQVSRIDLGDLPRQPDERGF